MKIKLYFAVDIAVYYLLKIARGKRLEEMPGTHIHYKENQQMIKSGMRKLM